jgi:putative Holliday junction resolvase
MRYLGIDFGTKRVGVAISDETNTMAFPYVVLQNNNELMREIEKIVSKERITELVIGESRDYQGNPNKIMSDINEFVEVLKKNTILNINLEPEFLTSLQAEHLQGKNEMHDASAAAIILQSFIDRTRS